MNIMMLLEMAAGGYGDRVAVGRRDDGLTYQQLFDRAGAAARRFEEAGAERVSLIDVSSVALPVALFGAAWAGKPFVPLNYRLTADEIRQLAREVAPSVTIVADDVHRHLAELDGVTARTRGDFLADLDEGGSSGADWPMDPEEIAVLLYTSGTTGAPKAAVLRHRHLVSYILGSVEFMGAGDDEATLVSVPPYHVAGMASILSSVYSGRRIVQLPTFDAADWVATARAENVTHAMVVPTMLARIVEHLRSSPTELPSLRHLSYGGGAMPRPVVEEALTLLPTTAFVNAYGLTETSSTVAVLGPDEHREALASSDDAIRRRLSSAGRPLPSVEVEIRDTDGHAVEPGETGEIWVRGEQVSGEYLGHGSRVDDGGWFPTRDGGWLDADGYLYLTGRLDDIIIRGGENISPGEIEDVLAAHPDVAAAAAVGIPDEQWGERVAAVVVAAPGATVDVALLQDHAQRELRSSRTPDVIVVREELPFSDTGKLLRRVLRDELASLDADR